LLHAWLLELTEGLLSLWLVLEISESLLLGSVWLMSWLSLEITETLSLGLLVLLRICKIEICKGI
jgi:hypothetical protein